MHDINFIRENPLQINRTKILHCVPIYQRNPFKLKFPSNRNKSKKSFKVHCAEQCLEVYSQMDFLGGFDRYVQQWTLQSCLSKPAKKCLEVYTQMDYLGGFERYAQLWTLQSGLPKTSLKVLSSIHLNGLFRRFQPLRPAVYSAELSTKTDDDI